RNRIQRLDQMKAVDRTPAAVRDSLFVDGTDQSRPPGQIDYFRTGDADHATVEPFGLRAAEDQHAVEFRSVAVNHPYQFFDQDTLKVLALGVHRVEFERDLHR